MSPLRLPFSPRSLSVLQDLYDTSPSDSPPSPDQKPLDPPTDEGVSLGYDQEEVGSA